MKKLVKFTVLNLTDRYSERKETAAALEKRADLGSAVSSHDTSSIAMTETGY